MEKNVSKKKPDNVADNPGILPYGSNVGAPAIKPTNISSWKEEKVISTNHYFILLVIPAGIEPATAP